MISKHASRSTYNKANIFRPKSLESEISKIFEQGKYYARNSREYLQLQPKKTVCLTRPRKKRNKLEIGAGVNVNTIEVYILGVVFQLNFSLEQ